MSGIPYFGIIAQESSLTEPASLLGRLEFHRDLGEVLVWRLQETGAEVLIGCGACQDGLNGIWTDKEMSVEAVIDEARAPAHLRRKLCVHQA